jgi:hypothetical protein
MNALEVIMRDIEQMNRVICGHRWNGLEEWVDCFYRLASLTDDELFQLAGTTAPEQQGPGAGQQRRHIHTSGPAPKHYHRR